MALEKAQKSRLEISLLPDLTKVFHMPVLKVRVLEWFIDRWK